MSDYDITVTVPNQGPKGETGDTGPANTLAVGTVTTLAAGAPATATITGTAPNQTLALGIPQGPIGQPGSNALTGFDNTPLKALLWTNPDTDVVRERINNDNSKTFTNFGALPSSFFSTAADLEFYRDFAGRKTLDHGTGPSITFTRNSNATFFDADGVLQTATTNAPRFDHDPASSNVSRGLLIEEARTNSIRNSQAGGSTNGVIGSGGVLPTNWTASGHNVNNVSTEIIGTGTEDGLAYIDIKLSGTPNATATAFYNFEGGASVTAVNGQAWTGSAYVRLVAGSLTNVTAVRSQTLGRTSVGAAVAGQNTQTTFTPTSDAVKTQRRVATLTISDATVERIQNAIMVTYASGNPIDLTLRIAAPQLEQGAFPTSYIPTTNAAATRAADSAVVTPISSFYNQAEGTLFGEGITNVSGSSAIIFGFHDTTDSNRIAVIVARAGTSATQAVVRSGGTNQTSFGSVSYPTTEAKITLAYKVDDVATSLNGATALTDSSATIPTLTHARVGGNFQTAWNGHIRKIAYWPKRLPNATLQQVTT